MHSMRGIGITPVNRVLTLDASIAIASATANHHLMDAAGGVAVLCPAMPAAARYAVRHRDVQRPHRRPTRSGR